MKLSEKKQAALYRAIADTMIDFRISITKKTSDEVKDIDGQLFYLTNRIWSSVERALGLDKGE